MIEEKLLSLSRRLARGKGIATEQKSTRLAQRNDKVQQGILSDLKDIGKSGSLETIVAAEKSIVKFDLKEYANSKNMMSSLTTAQKELEAIETNIGLVGDPKRYKEINMSHVQPKVRDSSDLPLDSARIAFRSHAARLINYDKTKSDDLEKAIIQARQQNIRTGEKLYIGWQEETLGRGHKEPTKTQPKVYTEAQYQKFAEQFLAQAKAQGMSERNIAAIRDGIQKGIAERTKPAEAEKRPAPKKSKAPAEPDIER
ncbi:MAG: hypothetical protein LBU53_12605 [Zoogloeaceae bacterium]|jgi:hypothetical protein|nr:hypothetical protein [Zoogloeaceae bacterium]